MFAALASGAADTKLDLKSKLLERKIIKENEYDTQERCFWTFTEYAEAFKTRTSIKNWTKFFSEAALDEEEEEICSAGVGAVHQAVLDNNLEKLEKLIEVKTT